jgi:N-acetyl-gamma-glutamyl-phosphate reductase
MSTASIVSASVIGASGYVGAELLRLINEHPLIELRSVFAHSQAGLRLGEVFSSWAHSELILQRFDPDQVASESEVAFLGLPHGAAQEATFALRSRGVMVIDLSSDFRFSSPRDYQEIYGTIHEYPDLLEEAVYGLPELDRSHLKGAQLIACPGCYPTSVTLGALPAIRQNLLSSLEVIADCKSGISGAGRKTTQMSLFSERGECVQGYKTLSHRHGPEIELNLKSLIVDEGARASLKVHFAPHLVPMARGILSTLFMGVKPGVTEERARSVYEEAYRDEPFVTILPPGEHPNTLSVRGTNRCHLGLTLQGGMLVVHSAIDNLCKGSAGQAIQCFNIALGFEESLGLKAVATYP